MVIALGNNNNNTSSNSNNNVCHFRSSSLRLLIRHLLKFIFTAADATSPTSDNNITNNNINNNNLDDPSNPTISALQTSLSQAQSHIVSLEQTLAQDKELLTLYEDSLAEATEKIRTYIFTQQTSLSQLHKTYADLLEQARWETVQAQLTHQAWQENLGQVSEKMREAVRMREVEGRPYRGRIAALKSENRLLRRMVGWEVAAESEDEDEMGEGSAAGASGAGVEGSGVGLAAAVAAAQERAASGGSAGLGEEGGHRQPLFGDGRVGMRDLSI